MNDKFEKLIRETVVNALAEKGSDVVSEMANDLLSRKVDPYTGGADGGYYGFINYMSGGAKEKKISYLEFLAREAVRGHVKSAVKKWFADRSAKLKRQIMDRIDAEAIADSYMRELVEVFDSDTFSVSLEVSKNERGDDY